MCATNENRIAPSAANNEQFVTKSLAICLRAITMDDDDRRMEFGSTRLFKRIYWWQRDTLIKEKWWASVCVRCKGHCSQSTRTTGRMMKFDASIHVRKSIVRCRWDIVFYALLRASHTMESQSFRWELWRHQSTTTMNFSPFSSLFVLRDGEKNRKNPNNNHHIQH